MILVYCAVSFDTSERTRQPLKDDRCEVIHQALESSPWRIGEQESMKIYRIFERALGGNHLERW